jgi:hypothetical protein
MTVRFQFGDLHGRYKIRREAEAMKGKRTSLHTKNQTLPGLRLHE